jgi:hypothetical protein
MTSGRCNRRKQPNGPVDLIGSDVELRTVGGAVHRGEVAAVGPDWLVLDRRTGGRALIRVDQLVACYIEDFAVPAGKTSREEDPEEVET